MSWLDRLLQATPLVLLGLRLWRLKAKRVWLEI